MALMDPISPAEVASTDPMSPTEVASKDDDQLPSLPSMAIEGFPPLQQSKHAHEAEKLLKQHAERYPNVSSLESFYRVGLSFSSYVHAGVISSDRLVAMSIQYALAFVLDDLFFDNPDDVLMDEYGIDRGARGSPQKIKEYFDHVNVVFCQRQPPDTPAKVMETMISELGRDILEMSNPEWFKTYAECVDECYQTGVSSHADIVAGRNSCFQDLEPYATMRAGNAGGKFIQLLIEFGNNVYIPRAMRSDPDLQAVTAATSIHVGFANDIFSYHKESSQERNPRNLISVLMNCEGKSFVQALHRAIELVNQYAHTILDFEPKASNSVLLRHLQDIKAVIAGHVYYSCMDERYRHPASILPELRDMTTIWKAFPQSEAPNVIFV